MTNLFMAISALPSSHLNTRPDYAYYDHFASKFQSHQST